MFFYYLTILKKMSEYSVALEESKRVIKFVHILRYVSLNQPTFNELQKIITEPENVLKQKLRILIQKEYIIIMVVQIGGKNKVKNVYIMTEEGNQFLNNMDFFLKP